jgi:phosphatidylserine decarboxylase
MTLHNRMLGVLDHEGLNFLLTNRIPRVCVTRFIGWFSRIEQPLIRDLSIAVWRFFSGLDLSEAKKTQFRSMHDCFTRELKEGARPVDARPEILVSPCDAIVGACGAIAGTRLYQIKGMAYTLEELLCDRELVAVYENGCYATLRLTSGMYHRFHAPHQCRAEQVAYIPGDTWNVNPPALRRIDKLFCKNARAVVRTTLAQTRHTITLVPVAAILVSGIRLNFAAAPPRREGTSIAACNAQFKKGEEMGWFEHGSTIVVFAPRGFSLCSDVREGATIRIGRPLLRLPECR